MSYPISTNEYSVAITEVLYILKYLPKDMTSNIPSDFLEFFNENAISTYKPDFDLYKGLDSVKLNHKTKILLAIIYRNYICSEQERLDYDKILIQNENEHQIKLKEKYNTDNIFKETKTEKNSDNINKLVIYKKSYFTRFKDFIKKILHK